MSQIPDFPPILSGPALAAALALLCSALGRRALTLFRVGDGALPGEVGFLQLAVGAGLLQFVPYSLGALHSLSERNVVLSIVALAALLFADLRVVASDALALARRSIAHARSLDAATRAWTAAFALLMGMLLVRALVLGPFGDDDGYHLSAPKRWLASGELRYLPTYPTTNASMGFEMLYTIALSLAGPLPVKVVHYGAGLLTLVGIWLAARRMGSPAAGRLVIAGLLVATPFCNLPFLFGLAYVDFGATWMSLGAMLCWLVWREANQPRWLGCMALCIGFAGSFKTTALALGVAWAPVLLWEARRRAVAWSKALGYAVALGGLVVAPVLPWSWRSWKVTGNPAFPLLSNVIPTRDFGPELSRVFGLFMHYYSWGVASGAGLDEGSRKRIVLVTLAAIALVAVVVFATLRRPTLRAALVFSTLFMLISVAVAGMVFRYWLPGIIGMALVLCVPFTQRWGTRPWAAWLAPATMSLALAVHVASAKARSDLGSAARVASGVVSAGTEYASVPGWQTWQYLNRETPPDARVLFVSFYTSFSISSMGAYWVDRPCYTTDSHLQQTVRLDDWEDFLASLQRLGVTHFVVASSQTSEGRHGFRFPALANEYSFGRRLAAEHAEKLATFGLMEVYRLRQPVVSSASPYALTY